MRIVWFIPHAVALSHTQAEFELIHFLTKENMVTLIQCDGVFSSFCSGMSYHGLNVKTSRIVRQSVCINCNIAKKKLNKSLNYNLNSIELSELISKDKIREIFELNKFKTLKELSETKIEDVPVGEYSKYTATLRNKSSIIQSDEVAVQEVRNDLNHSMTTYLAMKQLLSSSKFEFGVVYNLNYATNRTFIEILKINRIKTLSIQTGAHSIFGKNSLAPSFTQRTFQEISKSKAWISFYSKTVKTEHYEEVKNHLENSRSNRDIFSYSKNVKGLSVKEIKNLLGIKNNNPCILIVLSSPDEYQALIDSGIDFSLPRERINDILNVVMELSKKRPEWNFIIRPHPRMFSNYREKVSSKYAIKFLKNSDLVKHNIFVNVPKDEISIYDLIKIIDVNLNVSSTAGLEIAATGGAVLTIDSKTGFRYPSNVTPNVSDLNKNRIEESIIELLNSNETIWRELAIKYYIFIFRIYEIRFTNRNSMRNFASKHRFSLFKVLVTRYRSSKFSKIQIIKSFLTVIYLTQIVRKFNLVASMLDNSEVSKINFIFSTKTFDLDKYLLFNVENYK
jgi:hypothetical protein